MRIAPIIEAIPEASFIVCRRDYVDNGLSILKGRIKNLNSKDKWWSLPPKEIHRLVDLPWPEQIAGQVFYTYQQIEEDKERFGSDRFFEIRYEDFCEDVHSSAKQIERFLSPRGCSLEQKYEIPTQFQAMRADGIEPDDRKIVAQAVQNFFSKT